MVMSLGSLSDPCIEFLPIATFHHQRDLNISELCPMCGVELETTIHYLPNCFKAHTFWASLSLSFALPVLDFAAWVWMALRDVEVVSAAVLCARDMIQDIEASFGRSLLLQSPLNCLIWLKPPLGMAKVNCDASIFSNNCRVGFGCVIEDHFGEWVRVAPIIFLFGPSVVVKICLFEKALCLRGIVPCATSSVKQILEKPSLLSSVTRIIPVKQMLT
ncbi:hypothetical protein PIB30_033720 [Stylosanthes scabra]|uniref:Reverse transcriptase zinc-binding domain-containing protein n=1 Tax=Stylosanthes scabra TaxID=79078 RepID=A0ABU6YBF7_9FABA|nr:hypothetical protein [Stylosanthes scabra]